MSGASLVWSVSNPGNRAEYAGQKTVTSVVVEKQIEGVWVQVHSTAGDGFEGAALSWDKAAVAGTTVELRYRVANTANGWSTVNTTSGIETRGSRYWVDLSTVANNVYEYELSYTRPGETAVYASGAGQFSVTGQSSVGSQNIVGFVETGYVDVASTRGAVWTGYNDGYGTTYSWVGGNEIDLEC